MKNKKIFGLILILGVLSLIFINPSNDKLVKTSINKVSNIIKNASTSTVTINYKAGTGIGNTYTTTVTPSTQNYAKDVVILALNKDTTKFTHDDVTKTIGDKTYSYDMIITGWKLVSVVQNGVTINTFEEPEKYNYSDKTNAKKDIGRIYAEQGYYVVPDGVTEATFEAVYGWAIYVKSPYTSMVYDTNYWFDTDSSIASGRTGSADSNFGTNDTDDVVASIKRAYEIITLTGEITEEYTMYDHTIVLLSNIYDVRASAGSQPTTCYTDTYEEKTISTCNGTSAVWGYTSSEVATTITSNPNGTTRYNIYVKAQSWGYNLYQSIRFDYVRWAAVAAVSGGVNKANPALYSSKATYSNILETTERFTTGYGITFHTAAVTSLVRIMGGSINVMYTSHPFGGTIDNSVLKYVHVGGLTSGMLYSNTANSELSTTKGTVNNPPTLCVTGGNLSNIFLAGNSSPSTLGFTREDKTVYMYAVGGRISGSIYGSGASSLSGNAYIDLDGVTVVGAVYGGGSNAVSTITGDVTINIKNSNITNVYGGPQYGAILGTSKVTIANSTISSNVYGAGYGATSATNTRMAGQGGIAVTTAKNELNSVVSCSDDGMTCYDANGNILSNIKKINNQYRRYPTSAMVETLKKEDNTDYLGFYNGTDQIRTRNYFSGGIELTTVTHYWNQTVSSLSAATVQDVDLTIKSSTVNQNVYAGGNRGSVNGKVKLEIINSNIKGNVYGGGYTVTDNTVAIYHRQFSLYNGVYAYLNSSGNVAVGGGDNNYYVNGVAQSGMTLNETFTWRNYDYLLTNSTDWTDEDKANYESYWGSGKASTANVKSGIDYVNKVVYSETADKMGTVYGTSNVIINNSTISGSLYGGGYAGLSNDDIIVNIQNSSTITGNVYAGSYSSKVTGTGTINLDSTSKVNGNVFGGGEGTTSSLDNSYLNLNGKVLGSVYGGSYAGTVTGTANVTIGSTGTISNYVYGGGYGDTSVINSNNINLSGTVSKDVYAGSYAGKVSNTSLIKVLSTGVVTGNIYGGGEGKTSTIDSSTINLIGKANAIYGGSYAGSVSNNSSITIEASGIVNTNIYGGGYGETSTIKSNDITINGKVLNSVYGGSYAGGVSDTSNIIVASTGNVAVSLYGGGYGETSTIKNNNITVSGTVTKNVYGGSYAGSVTNKSTITVNTSGKINNNLFGAGEGVTSTIKDTVVTVKGIVSKDVYGGSDLGVVGMGIIDGVNNTANISQIGSTTVKVETGANIGGNVYGAGNGAPEGEASTNIGYGALFGKSNLQITGGTISGSVFGGGNRSRVFASTNESAILMEINGESNTVNIQGAAFGGGNSAGDSGVNASVPTVIGDTHVSIIDSDTKDNTTIAGGIYGGGNLCLVTGTKSIEIQNFGSESEVSIKTLQRADSVVLINSNVHLDSAKDVVNEFDTKEYSINRVKNLYFKEGSQVTINKTVNYLENITSDSTSSSNVNNYLYINNGLLTVIEKESGEYGNVTGYFNLGLINYQTGDGGGVVFANENSTGSFINVDSNTPIKYDVYPSNYKFWYLDGNRYYYDIEITGYTKAANTYSFEIPLVQLFNKKFDLYVKNSTVSSTLNTYISANPYIDLSVSYNDNKVSVLDLSSQTKLTSVTTASNTYMPTLTVNLDIESLLLEKTINGAVATIQLTDGTDTYDINLNLNIVEQIIESSVFATSGKWYNGVSLSENVNISKTSSYTVQFLTTYVPRLYNALRMTLETTDKFYKGTNIILIDNTIANKVDYYSYLVTSDTNIIELSDFIKLGTKDEGYVPHYSDSSISENLTFVIDLSESNTKISSNTIMLGHYSNNVEIFNNTASIKYIIGNYSYPSVSVSLNNYDDISYNFNLKINESSNTVTDTNKKTSYILEVINKDGTKFASGSYITVGSNNYYLEKSNDKILIPITKGDYSLVLNTLTSSSKDLIFNLYYSTDNLISSNVINSYALTVPKVSTYSFGINLSSNNRIISKDAKSITIPLVYEIDTSKFTVTLELQEKVINSDGTYSYNTLTNYLVGDDSTGKKTITLANNLVVNLESNKLVSMKTYNLLFTLTDSNGYIIKDSVEVVAK